MSRCSFPTEVSFPRGIIKSPKFLSLLRESPWGSPEGVRSTFPYIKTSVNDYKDPSTTVQFNGETWNRPTRTFFEKLAENIPSLEKSKSGLVINGEQVSIIYGTTMSGPFTPLNDDIFIKMKERIITEIGSLEDKFILLCNTPLRHLPISNQVDLKGIVKHRLKRDIPSEIFQSISRRIEEFFTKSRDVKTFLCNVSMLVTFLYTPTGGPSPLQAIILKGGNIPTEFKQLSGLDYTPELGKYYDNAITILTWEMCINFYNKINNIRVTPPVIEKYAKMTAGVLLDGANYLLMETTDRRGPVAEEPRPVVEEPRPAKKDLRYYIEITINNINNK